MGFRRSTLWRYGDRTAQRIAEASRFKPEWSANLASGESAETIS
jgi:hypothetical protein